ncbi:MAG: hypothetical protein QW761_02975, partial [Candidatus Aenigmatarchaeota archaeon]
AKKLHPSLAYAPQPPQPSVEVIEQMQDMRRRYAEIMRRQIRERFPERFPQPPPIQPPEEAPSQERLKRLGAHIELLRLQARAREIDESVLEKALRQYERELRLSGDLVGAARIRLELMEMQQRRTEELLRSQQLLNELLEEQAQRELNERLIPAMEYLAKSIQWQVFQTQEYVAVQRRLKDTIDEITESAALSEEEFNALASVIQTRGVDAAREFYQLLVSTRNIIEQVTKQAQELGGAVEDWYQRMRYLRERGEDEAMKVLEAVEQELYEVTGATHFTEEELAAIITIMQTRGAQAAREFAEELLRLRTRIEDIDKQASELGGALQDWWQRQRQIQETGADQAQAVLDAVVEMFATMQPKVWQFLQEIGNTFGRFIGDLIRGVKGFGESLADFFEGIANTIIQTIEKIASNAAVAWILSLLFGAKWGMGFWDIFKKIIGMEKGGVLTNAIVAAQQGGVFAQPTLAAIAERPGRREVVLPLPPGLRPEDLAKAIQGERAINLQLVLVDDRRNIPAPPPGYIQTEVVADILRRGPIYRVLRTVVP